MTRTLRSLIILAVGLIPSGSMYAQGRIHMLGDPTRTISWSPASSTTSALSVSSAVFVPTRSFSCQVADHGLFLEDENALLCTVVVSNEEELSTPPTLTLSDVREAAEGSYRTTVSVSSDSVDSITLTFSIYANPPEFSFHTARLLYSTGSSGWVSQASTLVIGCSGEANTPNCMADAVEESGYESAEPWFEGHNGAPFWPAVIASTSTKASLFALLPGAHHPKLFSVRCGQLCTVSKPLAATDGVVAGTLFPVTVSCPTRKESNAHSVHRC